MSNDLEKIVHICSEWVDAGAGDDCFWEPWAGQPSEDSLTPNMVLSVLESLRTGKVLSELGLRFTITCLSYDLDFDDAFQAIVDRGKYLAQEELEPLDL